MVEKTIGWHGVPKWNIEEALRVVLVLPGGPPHRAARAVDSSNSPWRLGAEAPSGVEVPAGKRGPEEAGMIGIRGFALADGWGLEAGP